MSALTFEQITKVAIQSAARPEKRLQRGFVNEKRSQYIDGDLFPQRFVDRRQNPLRAFQQPGVELLPGRSVAGQTPGDEIFIRGTIAASRHWRAPFQAPTRRSLLFPFLKR